ncbi:UTP--glucose-1-phosphate uridylyltransferase [candidate division WWE3 bacterium CG10_big_fil_rev_8_21_14_0_10_32_10]|uniref:UTP--glucose-1-phosphate uridylyltransferase n=1 Tax=candidate division WWE3 bacterium CG10_big_fil_rev_8_21_14_0_10_32_10 TaxID=1975090 RepID=A0A2H0RB53_UNCKA|nr:MAG: UTP--glucose-1-phosphate uridylyltransferase [candidate division WWE3 bacterium CG10_big_fil_rev_8_21_14_0_10_32_10]
MVTQNTKKVTKAVIPAAGFGTRFLPQTKAMPKEMLPLVDKPIIQHIVEELVDAGIKDVIIVTGYHKRSIEDHFDSPSSDLVETLRAGGEKKRYLLEEVERISSMANFYFARQKGPKGNITPLNNVKALIGNEPFLYVWADDFFDTDGFSSEFHQVIEAYTKYDCCILPCVTADKESDYNKYAYAGGIELSPGVVDVKQFIEKPGREKAPSSLAAVSSQLYTPDILSYLKDARKKLEPGHEFGYFDLITEYINNGGRVVAQKINANAYIDTGDKLAWLKAQMLYAVKDKDISSDFKQYLKDFVITLG